MKKLQLQTMIEVAIFAAFAMVLDLLPSIKFGPSISISFAMVPIFIIAFRWGMIASTTSGFLWGILQIVTGDAWILTPLQGFIEYFIAFSFIGVAGLFANKIQYYFAHSESRKAIFFVIIATFIGGVARYFWHFLAGVIFFKEAAYKAGKAPVLFSLTANGTAFFFSSLACAFILVLLTTTAPRIITKKS